MISVFKEYLNTFSYLSLKTIGILISNAKVKSYEAGEIILEEGECGNEAMILLTGFARQFTTSKNEDEITSYIANKGMLIGSTDSLFLKQPSKETIQAISSCIVVKLNHWKLEELAENDIELQKFKNQNLVQLIIHFKERLDFFSNYTPEQRFEYLIKNKPDIIKNVNQKYLASYIGVTPVSYSRIKSRLLNVN